MKDLITAKLRELEKTENIRILLAVESGSRAWGFASPDSDYDVRFVYVRPKEDYLRLDSFRDVIELPIENELDINGWDIQKALRLLYKSNPTLFEWFSSPVVYIKTEFADKLISLMREYFLAKNSLHHYINMACSNYRGYLKGDTVKAKKYFYVLRPVLACRWVIDNGTPPPMLFSELCDAQLPEKLKNDVERLLDLKMNSPETKEIPRIDALNEYIDESVIDIKKFISEMSDGSNSDWAELNKLFLDELQLI